LSRRWQSQRRAKPARSLTLTLEISEVFVRRTQFIFVALVVTILVGCSDYDPIDGEYDPPSEEASDFIAQEPFEQLQYEREILDWNDIEFFSCAYGEGLDCPSGCFYSSAVGLRYNNRIGWLGFQDYHGYHPDSTRFYNFVESDTLLFDADTWFVLMGANWWACFDMLLPALAFDEQTSRSALLALSTILYTHESQRIAELLVENSAIATDTEILGILAALPVIRTDIYAAVRARAQELLDALGGPAQGAPEQ
jgi:hypothetical protein